MCTQTWAEECVRVRCVLWGIRWCKEAERKGEKAGGDAVEEKLVGSVWRIGRLIPSLRCLLHRRHISHDVCVLRASMIRKEGRFH